jgi:hypothetical protein
VYHFDERGIHLDTSDQWNGICICVPIRPLSQDQFEVFDFVLEEYFQAFQARRYHPLQQNCYDFVVGFLNQLRLLEKSDHTKEEIVEKYIKAAIYELEQYFFLQTSPRICDFCERKIVQTDSYYHCLECNDFDMCQICYEIDPSVEKLNHLKSHCLRHIQRR